MVAKQSLSVALARNTQTRGALHQRQKIAQAFGHAIAREDALMQMPVFIAPSFPSKSESAHSMQSAPVYVETMSTHSHEFANAAAERRARQEAVLASKLREGARRAEHQPNQIQTPSWVNGRRNMDSREQRVAELRATLATEGRRWC